MSLCSQSPLLSKLLANTVLFSVPTVLSFPECHINGIMKYLFLAALGLRCCAQAFSSCGEWGLLLIAVHGLLIAVASLVVEHGL